MLADLDQLLHRALHALAAEPGCSGITTLDPQLERVRDTRHGDFTTNIAMRAAKLLQRKPRDIAAELVKAMPDSKLVTQVDVAGPGFVNFTLSPTAYHEELRHLIAAGSRYGQHDMGKGRRILIEYLSANPTGPLHVGHGRHAAYGASLANLLRATGVEVDEEYYVNDAGRQMDILAASVWFRYAQLCGIEILFPGNAYQGRYVRDIAARIHERDGETRLGTVSAVAEAAAATAHDADGERRLDQLIAAIRQHAGEENFAIFFQAALDSVLGDIRADLEEFGVRPGRWYSERRLTETGAVERALAVLEEHGQLYAKDGATWFRTTDYGDDKDRVVVRENGTRTYFASDIAYHLDKCERGYDQLLNVLGADHHGYVARLLASIEALGRDPDILEVRLVQFVALYRGITKAQMSTRSGEYVTLRELRNEVGNDAARFFYVARSNDQQLDFDLELAKSRSNDNPVYYVQYAHARVASLMRKLEGEGLAKPDARTAKLDQLVEEEERTLLVQLTRYPEAVSLAAEQRAPQHLVHYVRELAAAFHANYNAHRVLVDDHESRDARILLSLATQQVIANALGLLGVAAPESM